MASGYRLISISIRLYITTVEMEPRTREIENRSIRKLLKHLPNYIPVTLMLENYVISSTISNFNTEIMLMSADSFIIREAQCRNWNGDIEITDHIIGDLDNELYN